MSCILFRALSPASDDSIESCESIAYWRKLLGVPCTTSGVSNCYWDLVYNVNPKATAGDTFSVEVGFDGSPDHLLP